MEPESNPPEPLETTDPELARSLARYCSRAAKEEDRIAQLAQQRALRSQAGRNDPCPCGSGKKFKKCCLDKG